jgi:cystathionine beta-lyase
MTDDFDQIIDRRHSASTKWRKYGPDVLPLWVADMDFVSPEPVIRALRTRIEHGIFGYDMELPEFHETVVDWLYKRYAWRVAPEALVILPGVITEFNLAGRAVTVPGDGILMQTPVYPPILRAPTNMDGRRDEAALTRLADGR